MTAEPYRRALLTLQRITGTTDSSAASLIERYGADGAMLRLSERVASGVLGQAGHAVAELLQLPESDPAVAQVLRYTVLGFWSWPDAKPSDYNAENVIRLAEHVLLRMIQSVK